MPRLGQEVPGDSCYWELRRRGDFAYVLQRKSLYGKNVTGERRKQQKGRGQGWLEGIFRKSDAGTLFGQVS